MNNLEVLLKVIFWMILIRIRHYNFITPGWLTNYCGTFGEAALSYDNDDTHRHLLLLHNRDGSSGMATAEHTIYSACDDDDELLSNRHHRPPFMSFVIHMRLRTNGVYERTTEFISRGSATVLAIESGKWNDTPIISAGIRISRSCFLLSLLTSHSLRQTHFPSNDN